MTKPTNGALGLICVEHLLTEDRLMQSLSSQSGGIHLLWCCELTEVHADIVASEGKYELVLGFNLPYDCLLYTSDAADE